MIAGTYAERARVDCSLPIMPIYPQADKSPALNWRTSCRVDAGLSSNLCSSLSERSWTKPQASLFPANIDTDILAFDPSQSTECLVERRHPRLPCRFRCSAVHQHADPPRPVRLLCGHRERPRDHSKNGPFMSEMGQRRRFSAVQSLSSSRG